MKIQTIFIARAVVLLWALFWLFFFAVESFLWHTPLLVAASWTGLGVLFLILALVPWRWEAGGGFLLAIVGFAAAVTYVALGPPHLPLGSRIATTLLLGGPPFLAGIVFLQHRHAEAARP